MTAGDAAADAEYVLRPGLPVPLLVLGSSLVVVGLGLIVWAPFGVRLVVGVALGILGLAAVVGSLLRLFHRGQAVALDHIGIRLGMPRPADIAWAEIVGVRETGRRLSIDLRDRTQLVIDGEAYPRGYDQFKQGLVTRLEQRSRR